MSANAVDDYVKAREDQFNTITRMAYLFVILITIGGIAFIFA